MSGMKGPISKLVQMPLLLLYHALIWFYWSHLMVPIWGMHFQNFANTPLQMRKCLLVYPLHL